MSNYQPGAKSAVIFACCINIYFQTKLLKTVPMKYTDNFLAVFLAGEGRCTVLPRISVEVSALRFDDCEVT